MSFVLLEQTVEGMDVEFFDRPDGFKAMAIHGGDNLPLWIQGLPSSR